MKINKKKSKNKDKSNTAIFNSDDGDGDALVEGLENLDDNVEDQIPSQSKEKDDVSIRDLKEDQINA